MGRFFVWGPHPGSTTGNSLISGGLGVQIKPSQGDTPIVAKHPKKKNGNHILPNILGNIGASQVSQYIYICNYIYTWIYPTQYIGEYWSFPSFPQYIYIYICAMVNASLLTPTAQFLPGSSAS